jgi:hypothetical protein
MRAPSVFMTTEGTPDPNIDYVKGDLLLHVNAGPKESRMSTFTDTGWYHIPPPPPPSPLETIASKIRSIKKRIGEIIAGEKFSDIYE